MERTHFLVPALYSYGDCSEVPYPQTLHMQLTTQLHDADSRAVILATGKSTIRLLWALQQHNVIDNVFEYPLIQLHEEARLNIFCLNSYCFNHPSEEILQASNGTCTSRDAGSGVYAFVREDETISFIITNKGPNFMHIYAVLPFDDRRNVTYYILNPTHYLDNYIQAFAVRALEDDTQVTIVPTSTVRIFRPALSVITPPVLGLDIVTVEAYDSYTVNLIQLETIWVEAVVETCSSRVTLTGSRVDSSYETAVYSVQALCNKTLDSSPGTTNSSRTLPFSLIMSPLCQLPPIHKWGTHFITDLTKLKSFTGAEIEFVVVSFSIISAMRSEVSIKCHSPDSYLLCHAVQWLGEGEIWHYQLHVKTMLQAEAISITGNGTILVLHEIYAHGGGQAYHSQLLQPVEWFTIKQVIPISYSLMSRPQKFSITLVIPDNSVTIEQVLVWDNKENEMSMVLADYGLVKNHSLSRIEEYTLVRLEVDAEGYDGNDFVIQFTINTTENTEKLKFGASVFSFNGYAFSNGYVLGNLLGHQPDHML